MEPPPNRAIAEVGSPSELRPEFLSQPGVFSVREGDAVVLPCSVRHVGKYPVVWQQGKRVLAARSIIIESDQRLSLVDGHNLRIDGVTLADAAQYSCLVSSKPLIELTHTVDVLYSPKVTTVPESGQLITDQGSNVTLECTAEGNPQPAITWRKQHGTLPSGDLERPGRKLHISRIVREMAGVYECVADNGLGSPGVGSVSLQVQYPPEIEVERSTIYTGEGMEVKLVCTVIAIPPATAWPTGLLSPVDPSVRLPNSTSSAGRWRVSAPCWSIRWPTDPCGRTAAAWSWCRAAGERSRCRRLAAAPVPGCSTDSRSRSPSCSRPPPTSSTCRPRTSTAGTPCLIRCIFPQSPAARLWSREVCRRQRRAAGGPRPYWLPSWPLCSHSASDTTSLWCPAPPVRRRTR
ncbi:lachesin-like isoform X3 [Amphibalanus amphitrite]|uniref:lachesin-like isoform X3 n=1 Tax=Amphibalanus amphitrite TaxID=1232801 RepID=UPI001C90A58D|nr:lachesin-like isoform X3 [Amphibalanus amphitrite]